MDPSKRTVSAESMQAEWAEIQAAQRDASQFLPLYNRYYEPIFRFIFRRTADENLTADLCSQVFLKAMQRLGNYSFKGVPFSAWLYRIAGNEVAQYYRAFKKNRVVSMEDAGFSDIMEEMDETDNEALRQLLIQQLDNLKDSDLQLIELRFFEHRPFKEIAEILDMTESNAKVKTYRILERLKKRLSN
ncbi:MAG: sigma-70 family RNA polymerase sigma factor [Saprospiraceae bacterium]|nr:sigma-70 family RNA polymerase sigma factor [Lewinella sp.]